MIFLIKYLDGKKEEFHGDEYERNDYWFVIHSGGRYCKDEHWISGYNVRDIQVRP